MIALWLLALHMLGDYVTQNRWMAANKLKSWWPRTIHVAMYTGPFGWLTYLYPIGTARGLLFLSLVFVTHWITDCRRWASDKQWCAKPIMVDQTIHILTLAILGTIFFGR